MTLPPVDSFDFEILDGPRYELSPWCVNPVCENMADHGHHLFRRKRGHPSYWVRLPDGKTVGNVVPLCATCHSQITGDVGGHKWAIRYYDQKFVWVMVRPDPNGQPIYVGPIGNLRWQPPGLDGEFQGIKPEPEAACPTCGTRPKPKRPRQARKRKTWTVQVPSDEEDGAQVMDDYVDALIPVFNLDPNGGAMTRYHTLTRALAFTLVNRDSVPEEAKVEA